MVALKPLEIEKRDKIVNKQIIFHQIRTMV